MGDSLSTPLTDLESYSFEEPFSHNINWWAKDVYVIDDEETLPYVLKVLRNCDVLYVDCEGQTFGGRDSQIGLIQIALQEQVVLVFDVVKCPTIVRSLKEIMESEEIIKVFHDCSGDAAALYNASNGEVLVKNAFDTQVAQKIIESRYFISTKEYSLSDLYLEHTRNPFPRINVKSYGNNKWTEKRPMSDDMIKYAAADVMVLPEIYAVQKSCMSREEVAQCFRVTSKKLTYKVPVQAGSVVRYCPSLDERASEVGGSRRGTGSQLQREEQDFPVGLAIAAGVAVGVGALAVALLAGSKKKK